MLGSLLGSLIDKGQIISEYLNTTIEKVARELNCERDEVLIMIKPLKKDFEPHLYKLVQGKPQWVRKMDIKEFVEHGD